MSKKFLVCIDSDGCAFDTMEIKHKECFCPSYINYFGLQAVSKYARDAWDFANLYSCWRGVNRFLVLLKSLDLLSERKEVWERNFTTPMLHELRKYVAEGRPLNNGGLEAYLKEYPDSEEIQNVLKWSYDVNERIGEMVHSVPPFPHVRENLEKLAEYADIVIVSATQQLALEREWAEHDLLPLITAVKGQESGSKKEIIASLKDAYEPGHVLMIGDAPGDRDAARANDALFYPINPDKEAQSWAKFPEIMEAFLNGTYAGAMEDENIAYFETLLPSVPSWETITYGKDIGKKFDKAGVVMHYPGNTVVADIVPGCPAYDVMSYLRQMVIDEGFEDYLCLLPEDSYHMTVIRGLNDYVRKDTHWPAALPKDTPMEQVDDYISAAIARAVLPGPARMKFYKVLPQTGCLIIQVVPEDDAQEKILRDFRDRAANEIGLFLPKHDEYKFHISLGYRRILPEGADAERFDSMIAKMQAYIQDQPAFSTEQPYMAYYSDMYAFSPERLPRD
jgi:phosphoglycolate phosphatase-like HAD superfamily hydrolase